MKKLLLLSSIVATMVLSACEVDPTSTSARPIANFTKDPDLVIIADKTSVPLINTSEGDIDDYFWEFEGGSTTSDRRSPNYTFDFEGAREVKLTVEGPGGSDERTLHFAVFAFDPNCNNVTSSSTHSTTKINHLRNNGLVKNGKIKFRNDYNVSIDLVLFSPSDWLNGKYTGKHFYTVASGQEGILKVNGSQFQFSNEWGVRVQSTNGVISCVRTVGTVANFNGTQYNILASTVLDGI